MPPTEEMIPHGNLGSPTVNLGLLPYRSHSIPQLQYVPNRAASKHTYKSGGPRFGAGFSTANASFSGLARGTNDVRDGDAFTRRLKGNDVADILPSSNVPKEERRPSNPVPKQGRGSHLGRLESSPRDEWDEETGVNYDEDMPPSRRALMDVSPNKAQVFMLENSSPPAKRSAGSSKQQTKQQTQPSIPAPPAIPEPSTHVYSGDCNVAMEQWMQQMKEYMERHAAE